MTRTETKGERKRTTRKKLLHKLFPWALNRLFNLWLNRFFLCSGMKIEFLLSTGIK